MFSHFDEAAAFIRERGIRMLDLKFTDLWGRWHHLSLPATRFEPKLLETGVGFDGSSVGFKSVNSGDMVMVPDLASAFVDPFWEVPTLSFLCTTYEAGTGELFPYDPRTIARRAEACVRKADVADRSTWGPEYEFYVFNGVSYQNGMNVSSYKVDSAEANWSPNGLGNGHSIPLHGGYHAIAPQDQLSHVRTAITLHLEEMGVPVKYHHHEVGGPGQCEIETPLMPLVKAGDAAMLTKYVTRLVSLKYGMTATFMPKPLYGEAGSGMHFHQMLWKGDRNVFFQADAYGCMSEVARHYIAGLLHHGPALLALTNPSTNSYRRLVPGFEAPISAIYSVGNRSAAIRIPKYANRQEDARFEFRPPDATCNPYLAMAAQLMAGLDGIKRRLDPTELGFGPVTDNIFSWSPERRAEIKALPTSLEDALVALERDHEFLLEGDVFSRDLIERWVERKRQESREVRNRPHPYEVELYYDL